MSREERAAQMDVTTADLAITISVAAFQESVALGLLRAVNDFVNQEIPDACQAAAEDFDGLPFELEVTNQLVVRRPLEDPS